MNEWNWSDQKTSYHRTFRWCGRWFGCALGVAMFLVFSQSLLAQNNPPARRVRPVVTQVASGPEVGQKIPAFRAPDQHGQMQDLNSVRGSKGTMVVFFRSADW